MARLGIDAVAMVDAELSEYLSVAPLPFVDRENCRNRLKVQIVARPVDGSEGRGQTGLDHRVSGQDGIFRALLALVEIQVIRNVRQVENAGG